MEASRVEQLLAKDRHIISFAIAAIFLIAAIYTVMGVGMPLTALEMTAVDSVATPMGENMASGASMTMQGMMPLMMPAVWSGSYAVLVFLMWWVMMIAMMLPSVASVVLLYSALIRRGDGSANVPRLAGIFLGGYLSAWAFFSLLATGAQWVLELRGIVSPMGMALTSNLLGATVLIAAGTYQFTPWKLSCLQHCQSPLQFLTERRRSGMGGAFLMGIEHGAFCLGCCWFLMALLFVGGIMNLYWIIGLVVFVMLEKLLLTRHWVNLSKVIGVGLWLAGIGLLVTGEMSG